MSRSDVKDGHRIFWGNTQPNVTGLELEGDIYYINPSGVPQDCPSEEYAFEEDSNTWHLVRENYKVAPEIDWVSTYDLLVNNTEIIDIYGKNLHAVTGVYFSGTVTGGGSAVINYQSHELLRVGLTTDSTPQQYNLAIGNKCGGVQLIALNADNGGILIPQPTSANPLEVWNLLGGTLTFGIGSVDAPLTTVGSWNNMAEFGGNINATRLVELYFRVNRCFERGGGNARIFFRSTGGLPVPFFQNHMMYFYGGYYEYFRSFAGYASGRYELHEGDYYKLEFRWNGTTVYKNGKVRWYDVGLNQSSILQNFYFTIRAEKNISLTDIKVRYF